MRRETVFSAPPVAALEQIAAGMRARNAPHFDIGGEKVFLFFLGDDWRVQAAFDLGLAPFCLLNGSVCFRVGRA